MATPLFRWNDDRLDDLQRVVNSHTPIVNSVGELRVEIRGLSEKLDANTRGQAEIARQFEDAQLEPFTRKRRLQDQLAISVASAVVGGGIAVAGALIAGGR